MLASITLGGCAIWAMHFIGMLAYDPGAPVSCGIPLTLASLVLPILFTMVGLYVVHRWRASRAAWLAAGAVMGLGVATMHFTGMAAMRIRAMSVEVDYVANAVTRSWRSRSRSPPCSSAPWSSRWVTSSIRGSPHGPTYSAGHGRRLRHVHSYRACIARAA